MSNNKPRTIECEGWRTDSDSDEPADTCERLGCPKKQYNDTDLHADTFFNKFKDPSSKSLQYFNPFDHHQSHRCWCRPKLSLT